MNKFTTPEMTARLQALGMRPNTIQQLPDGDGYNCMSWHDANDWLWEKYRKRIELRLCHKPDGFYPQYYNGVDIPQTLPYYEMFPDQYAALAKGIEYVVGEIEKQKQAI
jgi:hypothetical protein